MDVNVITGVIRAVAPAALAYAVGKGWIPQSSVADITAAIVTLGAAAWSVATNVNTTPIGQSK